jgi:hypothetical protein
MQPTNLSLDPASTLWSNNSPNNNYFTQTSPSDNTGDSSMGMQGSGLYSQSIGSLMGGPVDMSKNDGQQMPNLSANSSMGGNDNSAGEVFMGVQTPQPGGIPNWKWTVMSDQKRG